MLTNAIAAAPVNEALSDGSILTIQCPDGDKITASRTEVIRWKKSKYADQWGRVVVINQLGIDAGNIAVENCGRGLCAKAARAFLGIAAGR